MLQSEEKAQVEQYVTKISKSIFREAEKYIQSGMPDKQVIDRIITITVNKFTPESKMILSSVYNMMMERTLAKPIYQITRNRAAFFEMNILQELNSKFLFDVPNQIDYEESRITIDKWIADGVIVVAGGVISFLTTNPIPIGMAVIIAAVMLFILKNGDRETKQDISRLIQEYLKDVSKTMMEWLDTVQEYYDARVEKLERELIK